METSLRRVLKKHLTLNGRKQLWTLAKYRKKARLSKRANNAEKDG
jgi:hypothetical protein